MWPDRVNLGHHRKTSQKNQNSPQNHVSPPHHRRNTEAFAGSHPLADPRNASECDFSDPKPHFGENRVMMQIYNALGVFLPSLNFLRFFCVKNHPKKPEKSQGNRVERPIWCFTTNYHRLFCCVNSQIHPPVCKPAAPTCKSTTQICKRFFDFLLQLCVAKLKIHEIIVYNT